MPLHPEPLASKAQAYLADVEALIGELRLATTAVATNSLSELEDSLFRQRATCARLAELEGELAGISQPASALSSPVLAARIRAALLELQDVTRHYTALLKHFTETARLFAGMFRGYSAAGGNAFSSPIAHSTWSCEL